MTPVKKGKRNIYAPRIGEMKKCGFVKNVVKPIASNVKRQNMPWDLFIIARERESALMKVARSIWNGINNDLLLPR